jgi:hypothetical protein
MIGACEVGIPQEVRGSRHRFKRLRPDNNGSEAVEYNRLVKRLRLVDAERVNRHGAAYRLGNERL